MRTPTAAFLLLALAACSPTHPSPAEMHTLMLEFQVCELRAAREGGGATIIACVGDKSVFRAMTLCGQIRALHPAETTRSESEYRAAVCHFVP
jgi:hypothetical protein